MAIVRAGLAAGGKTTVAEVEEIVPNGTFDPDCIHTPGIYVDRIVLSTIKETANIPIGETP